ncbi:hypothetical protein [Janthinobacterium sp. 78]|uniref:hypothetical protein n=1 Tax=Janthinobacterium sp. 78 TaxID=2135631 RepID=UPI000D5E2871|nr:hypothetical protein [Janthinobacterium sp. 78]PVX37806.1 hypothetical protein C8C92_4465 [Janthinobacterium sp. 78]
MAESIDPQEQALREMLPDYLNGHAPADVASRIAARLEHDPDWAADAGWLGEIRTAIEAEAASMDPAAGLAQLHRRLERPGFWRRCYQRLALPALAPVAITALASLCIGQAWLLWQQAAPADQLRWRSVPGAVAPPASLRVQFLPTASMAQVAAALEQAQAGIVAGPLPDHGYLLDAADPQAALQSLRASGVVAAASLASGPGTP